jgi:hypothetical protein
MLERTHNSRAVSRRRAAAIDTTRGSSPEARRRAPECTTARWKHRVEAEARARLKREVRGISVAR